MSCACKIGGGPDGVCFECKSRRAFHARLKKLEPAETMALVEGWAWEENARRDRTRAIAMTPHRPMTATEASLRLGNEWEFDGLDARDHATLLAHIDGEPARIAAACEEVREAVARHVMGPALKRDPDLFADHLEEVYAATIRRMPLTATPLADEIAALRARVAALERERDMLQTALRDNSAAHSETGKALLRAEADGDEKETERAALETALMAFKARFAEVLAERDALRAQVEATT